MALNTRFATAIDALVVLAAEPGKFHTSEDVARNLRTNPVVVRRIFLQLQTARLTLSHKGPGGGAMLARPAQEITLRDIYRAVLPQGLAPAPSSSVHSAVRSTLSSAFRGASRAFERELEQTTLSRLVKKVTKKSKSSRSANATASAPRS